MAKFQLRPIDAVQLTWENRNEICELLKVGKFSQGKPEECYLDPVTMLPFDDPEQTSEILGLKIPSNFDRKKYELVKQGDWLVNIQDTFRPMSDELFRKLYEPVETEVKSYPQSLEMPISGSGVIMGEYKEFIENNFRRR